LKVVIATGADVVAKVAMVAYLFLASIYISKDAPILRSAFLHSLPVAYQPEISSLLTRIERVWLAFFQGELKLMLFIGVLTTIGLIALGMPGALYLGVIAGLLEIVPSFGPFIATVPAVIVALIEGPAYLSISHLAFAGLIILFYILVQQVENNLVVPRVLGSAVELPPLVVMTGVVVGASVGGILGALLATPIIATSRAVLRYVYQKMLGQEPDIIDETPSKARPTSSSNWLASLPVEIQKRLRSRLPKSRQGSGEE
jgi:predicted PurR-regulated permease PerM